MDKPSMDAVAAARLAAVSPRRAPKAEHRKIDRMLARAFADDPVMSWGFRDGPKHMVAMNAYFDFAMDEQCSPHDCVFAASDFSAAAVWLPPEGLKTLSLPLMRMLLRLPKLMQITGFSRMGRAIALGDAMEKHHPPEPPHWYLFFLGVDPSMRGQGLGSSILEATLKTVDAAGMPAHLDNSNPKNTRLYERYGFRTITEYRARKDSPTILGMWRDARKGV